MIVLAIWLFLAGYTIAITGKRNLGLSYAPQPDGSIKAQDQNGNEAKAYSLLDVVQCQDASVSLQGQPAPLGASQSSRPASAPNPIGQLAPRPVPAPVQLPAIEEIPIRIPGLPGPGGLLGGLMDFERGLERDVYGGLSGATQDVRSALSRIHLPGLSLPGVRPLP